MNFLLPFLVLFLSIPFSKSEELSADYYKTTCPEFEKAVREQVHEKQTKDVSTAAGTLRLFFHDCMIEGCDGSILIASNHLNQAEKEHDLNINLPGDAFDIVGRIKSHVEMACPGVVSCADVLVAATRNLIMMVGGPPYPIKYGRKDGLISQASRVEGNLPRRNQTFDQQIQLFEKKGFTIQEMAALIGAHTIGFSHCKEFADRLYGNDSAAGQSDPDFNPKYVEALKGICKDYKTKEGMSAFNDVLTPGKFDNMYYKNLPRGLGLLTTDHILFKDPRTKGFVEKYAADEQAFFDDFSKAIEKLSRLGVKTGTDGEVRRRCDAFNTLKT